MDPSYATAYNNRGAAYLAKDDYERAIRDFDQAINLNLRDALAHNNRGLAYWGKGEYDLAIRDFEKALQLALANGEKGLANIIQSRLEWYKAKRPYP